MLQIAKEYFMVNSVKCFGKVEENSEGRSSLLLSWSYHGMKKRQGHVGAYNEIQIACGKRVRIYQRMWWV